MCCGKRSKAGVTISREIDTTPEPRHRALKSGVAAIYVGGHARFVKGSVSGFRYYLSPRSRHLFVDERDINLLIRHEDVVLRP